MSPPRAPAGPTAKRASLERERPLFKISELARRSGVPAATVKHYVRQGLVVPVKTGRNIAYFDDASALRIRRIKQLQQDGFLPLRVIKGALDGEGPTLARALSTVKSALTDGAAAPRTLRSLLDAGVSSRDLEWLERLGVIRPVDVEGEPAFGGDDLELLRTLGAARKVGITNDMLPVAILGDYVAAIQRLVEVELTLFREGVLPRAGDQLEAIAEAATKLSERLVVLLRRRLILPTLRAMAEQAASSPQVGKAGLTPRKQSRK